MTDWKATLNGSTMCGGDCTGDATVDACLLLPPDGLGVPEVRTEDLSYPQRDGTEHFSDWYPGRILTLTGLVGGTGCGCDGATDVREHAANLTRAWARQCEDVELVIGTECEPERVNLFTNGSFDANTSGWEANNSNTLTRDTGVYRSAPASGKATANNSTIMNLASVTPIENIEDFRVYRFRGYSRAATTARRFYWVIFWEDADGNGLQTYGDPVLNSNSGWTLHELVTNPPVGMTRMMTARLSPDTSVALNEIHYFDDLSMFDTNGSETNGPFGVRGRPRVASLVWRKGKKAVADFLGRFDSADHRLYILNADGEPGSGSLCSSIEDAPSGFVYDSAVDGIAAVDSHWPLDFPRIYADPSLPSPYQRAEDVIGSDDAQIRGGYFTGTTFAQQGPPISWNLSMSAIVGPAQLTGTAFPNPYTSAMFGWWQQTDGTSPPCGSTFSLGSSSVGQDALGQPSPQIRWAGANVAMNADTQAAFGFTDTLRNQPVLIVLAWTGTTLSIYAGHENSGATKLVQTVSVGAFPTPTLSAPSLTILGRVSNVMQAINGSPDGEAITDTLTPYAFDTVPSAVPLPDLGSLCVPIQVTFEAGTGSTFGDVYIFKEDGSYVGLEASGVGVDNPSWLDTDTGTARGLFDTTDFTPRITGDPFLQVNPGETLHIFGGGADSVITVCFRPAVLSA